MADRELIIVSRQTPSDYSTTVQQKSHMENTKVPADVILFFNGRNEPDTNIPQEEGINTHGMQSIRNILHKRSSYH